MSDNHNLHLNKIIQCIFALAFVLFVVSCKTTDKVPTTKNDVPQFENALLWKIEGQGLTEPSYLYGTIHLIEGDKFFWPKGTLAAFDEAEKIVFEIDMDDMFDISAQMGLLSKAFMKDNQRLSDFYSEEDYKIVSSHFDDMGIPLFFLERIKPMFLTVFASGEIDMTAGLGGDSSVKSYEMELYELAKQSSKDVSGLESMEFQMSMFDSIPYQSQADMLLESIKMSDVGNDVFVEMEKMYQEQRINDMIESMDEPGGVGGYEDLLLYQRNKNWIPIMGQMMKEGTVFFAVGAGHLAGKDGVLELLQTAGYTLTPLSI
ncbi:MAG: TraB/GumN family protein [Saprospiraceae bacterium]|nr:TraB/GumN family protein [Saprospiraceae bacterium]